MPFIVVVNLWKRKMINPFDTCGSRRLLCLKIYGKYDWQRQNNVCITAKFSILVSNSGNDLYAPDKISPCDALARLLPGSRYRVELNMRRRHFSSSNIYAHSVRDGGRHIIHDAQTYTKVKMVKFTFFRSKFILWLTANTTDRPGSQLHTHRDPKWEGSVYCVGMCIVLCLFKMVDSLQHQFGIA